MGVEIELYSFFNLAPTPAPEYKPVDCFWNVMAHAQKPDFVFRQNGRVHLNWASVQSTTGSRGERISGSNAGYTMFRGSVKSTGYPLHSLVSPSLPLPYVTVCHHISTGLYSLYGRLGEAQGRFGWVWIISPPPAFDPRIAQPATTTLPRANFRHRFY
jgi:hypothetical protein